MKHFTPVKSVVIILSIVFLSACSKSGSNPGPQNSGSKLIISSISQNAGPYATQVIITGSGFSPNKTDNKVFFNGHAAVIDVASSTELYTEVPLGAGTGNITVTSNGNTATGPIFTYQVTQVVVPFVGDAGKLFQPLAIAPDALGNLYIADTDNNLVKKATADGTVTTFANGFNRPSGISIGPSGNIYVSDTFNGVIKKITPTGDVSTITDASTGKAAALQQPTSLVVDASENIFVVTQIDIIQKITPAGVISTIANQIGNSYYGLALDTSGNIFAVDESSNVIYKIAPGKAPVIFVGNLNPIGGDLNGTGGNASFYRPSSLAIDGNNNLLVVDGGNWELRNVTPGAVVTTFAGPGGALSYGPIKAVNFGGVTGIAIDEKSGNIFLINGNQINEIVTE